MFKKLSSGFKRNILLILPILLIFLFYLLPPVDTDLGWHLRYGQQIFENHSVWKTNTIGFFLVDYQWAHSYSLYQLTTFIIYRYIGFIGLAIGCSLLIMFSLLPLVKMYHKKPSFLLGTVAFFFLASHPVTYLGWRSQLFSILGITLIYWLIISKKLAKPINFLILPVLFVLWTNLHGGFILGLFLVGLSLIINLFLNRKSHFINHLILISLSTIATLVNPFGLRIYSEIIRHSWYPLNQLIAEWVPPNNIGIILILIICSIVAFLILSTKHRLKFLKEDNHLFLVISWLIFTILAFKARRNLPFFALSSIHLIFCLLKEIDLVRLTRVASAEGVPSSTRRTKSSAEDVGRDELTTGPLTPTQNVFTIIIVGVLLTWKLFHFPKIGNDWNFICLNSQWTLPCQAVEYLKTKPEMCHNLFNAYEWGGYISWQLPKLKTFVDGRMPAWPTPEGKSPYTIYLEIIQGWPDSLSKLEQYQPDCLLLGRGFGLVKQIQNDPTSVWQKEYEDEVAVVYERK